MMIDRIEIRRRIATPMAVTLAIALWPAWFDPAWAAESDPPKASPTLQLFAEEAEARAHCPTDRVIRIEMPEGFFLHGDRGFGGVSLDHVYLCRDETVGLFAHQSN